MWKRKILAALAAVWLFCAFVTTVSAHETPDLTREGRISATLRDGSATVAGGTLTCFRVGDVAENDGNFSFVLTEEFQNSGVSLENLTSREAEALAAFALKNNLPGSTVSISDQGTALWEGLKPGLYLLVQQEPAKGYKLLSPFLVSLPTFEDGVYCYEVDASPKVSLENAPTQPSKPTQPTKPTKPSDSVLPQTGQLNWPVPVLVVAGLFFILLGWYLRFDKKDTGYEA